MLDVQTPAREVTRNMMEPVLSVQHLSVEYQSAGRNVTAVDDVSFPARFSG